MTRLLGLLAMTLLGLGIAACGTTSRGASSSKRPSNSVASDSAAKNSSVLHFGQEAGPVDKRTVTALVKRYYVAAAAEDGATACSLILSSVARSIPEDYGLASGPSYMRGGKTCRTVMSRLFAHFHRRMVAYVATLEVSHVRLKSKGGYAILSFKGIPKRQVNVVRQGDAWKLTSLLDSRLF